MRVSKAVCLCVCVFTSLVLQVKNSFRPKCALRRLFYYCYNTHSYTHRHTYYLTHTLSPKNTLTTWHRIGRQGNLPAATFHVFLFPFALTLGFFYFLSLAFSPALKCCHSTQQKDSNFIKSHTKVSKCHCCHDALHTHTHTHTLSTHTYCTLRSRCQPTPRALMGPALCSPKYK